MSVNIYYVPAAPHCTPDRPLKNQDFNSSNTRRAKDKDPQNFAAQPSRDLQLNCPDFSKDAARSEMIFTVTKPILISKVERK